MRIGEEISFRLKVSAFVCALLVTTIHCWSPGGWFSGVSGFAAWQTEVAFLVTDSISRVAVPWFFVMTGFFLARSFSEGVESRNEAQDTLLLSMKNIEPQRTHSSQSLCALCDLCGLRNIRKRVSDIADWYVMTLKKRFWSIYVPFVIWNLVYVVLYLVFGGKHGCSLGEPMHLLSKVFGWNPYERLGCMQFWYLQTVILWVVATVVVLPLLYGIRWLQIVGTGVLFVVWVSGIVYLPLPLAIGNFLWLMVGSVLGFSRAGILLTQSPQSSQSIIKPYPILRGLSVRRFAVVVLIAMLSIAAIIKVYAGVVRNMVVYGWADKCIIVMGVALLVYLVFDSGYDFRVFRSPMMKQFLGLSFFVFAFHGVVITVVSRLSEWLSMSEFATYIAKVLSALMLPIVVGLSLRRIMPRVFSLICGGRR